MSNVAALALACFALAVSTGSLVVVIRAHHRITGRWLPW